MNPTWRNWELQFSKRSLRERALISITIVLLLWALWYVILYWPNVSRLTLLQQEQTNLQTSIDAYNKQSDTMMQQWQQRQKEPLQIEYSVLQDELVLLNKQEKEIYSHKLSGQEALKTLEHMLKEAPGIDLIQVNTQPATGGNGTSSQQVYQQGLEIVYRSDYFSTLGFLQLLENLHLSLYWQSIDYQVFKYPLAKVTLRILFFSKKAGGLSDV